MTRKDDRTAEQKETRRWGVVARDNFMSGWGGAKNGYSRCAWACETLEIAQGVAARLRHRHDMVYVHIVDLRRYRPSRQTSHYHIYVEGREGR